MEYTEETCYADAPVLMAGFNRMDPRQPDRLSPRAYPSSCPPGRLRAVEPCRRRVIEHPQHGATEMWTSFLAGHSLAPRFTRLHAADCISRERSNRDRARAVSPCASGRVADHSEAANPTAGRAGQSRTYRSGSAGESGCLSAMTSTLQHPQIGAPRPDCVAILVGHHAR